MAHHEKPSLSEKDDNRTEFLLKFNSDRVDGLEAALERNWIAHLILAGVGLALVLPIGKFRNILADYFVHQAYDQTVVATVLLAILLYYFMKLGHLLTLYIEESSLQKQLLQRYLGNSAESSMFILRKSANFYVEAFLGNKFSRQSNTFWPYLLVTSIVVSLSQGAALYLVAQAFSLNRWLPSVVLLSAAWGIFYITSKDATHKQRLTRMLAATLLIALLVIALILCFKSGWTSVILLIAAALIVTLYILFWLSNRLLPQTRLIVVSAPVLVVVWLFIFAVTRR